MGSLQKWSWRTQYHKERAKLFSRLLRIVHLVCKRHKRKYSLFTMYTASVDVFANTIHLYISCTLLERYLKVIFDCYCFCCLCIQLISCFHSNTELQLYANFLLHRLLYNHIFWIQCLQWLKGLKAWKLSYRICILCGSALLSTFTWALGFNQHK